VRSIAINPAWAAYRCRRVSGGLAAIEAFVYLKGYSCHHCPGPQKGTYIRV